MALVFNKSTPTDGRDSLFALKSCLTAAGWRVRASGTGTGGVYNASGDSIGSSANFGSNSWFRIQDRSGVREFVFQKSGANHVSLRIKYSMASRFINDATGAASTNEEYTPSATDQLAVWGSADDTTRTYSPFYNTDGSYRYNIGADNASPYGFWSAAFTSGGGAVDANSVLCLDPLVGCSPSDANKFMIILRDRYSNLNYSTICSESAIGSANFHCSTVPSISPTTWVSYAGMMLIYQGGMFAPLNAGANPISGADETFPIVYAKYTSSLGGYKGVSTLMRWVGTSRAIGSTLSIASPGAMDRIVYDDISFPWDGTVPTV